MNILKLKTHEVGLHLIFYGILLILTILPLAGFRLGEIASVFPAIEITIIFYYSIYKPHILPLWLLFTYGIVFDLIYGLPIGISIIPMIITSYLLRSQRQIFYRKDFTIVFLGFVLACFLFLGLKLIVFSWYFSYLINYTQVLIQIIYTIFAYPILHYLLQLIEKIID